MKRLKSGLFVLGFFIASASLCAVGRADDVVITYAGADAISPTFTALCGSGTCDYGYENFSTLTNAQISTGTLTTNFTDGASHLSAGVSFSGTDTATAGTTYGCNSGATSCGAWQAVAQNEYGGVAGYSYPELYGPSASQATKPPSGSVSQTTLTLAMTGVAGKTAPNYFGIWISALDAYNNLVLYDGTTVVGTFDSAQLLAELGTCTGSTPWTTNPYCGNPTSQFLHDDPDELFVYINVFDLNGSITSAVLQNSGGTGFESDDYAVAYSTTLTPYGTDVPEPNTLALLAVAFGSLVGLRRGRQLT